MNESLTIAEQIHNAYSVITRAEENFDDILTEVLPDMQDWKFGYDAYDNSIEIYLIDIDPLWEPSSEIKKKFYDYGFYLVYWNFSFDGGKTYTEEIVGHGKRKPKPYRQPKTEHP